ncbi:MAG TPA: metal-dependent hydrolase [Chthonomonadales bacterium]|nr:metal-dependent hydrolase [Chthonomonadales bacterium]
MALNRGVSITWYGHSTFRIVAEDGYVLFIDPWIETNPVCPGALRKVDRCDAILLTHGHSDHVADAAPLARRTGATVVAIHELSRLIARQGVERCVGMNKGGTVRLGLVQATMVDARHSSSVQDGDALLYAGEAAGYVVTTRDGLRVYHAGDTNVFGDMALIGDLYRPEVALLPIGDHYTMSPREAARAIDLLRPAHVVPMHRGTFPALSGTTADLRKLTTHVEGLTVHDLAPGDTLE